jgi:hypothetical protein
MPGAFPNVTIAFNERQDSPKEAMTDEGFVAVMTVDCAWADRVKLARQLMGGAKLQGSSMIREDPARWPYYLDAWCQDVQIKNEDGEKIIVSPEYGTATYTRAILEATFKRLKWRVCTLSGGGSATEYISESIEPSAEFVTMPNQKLFWDALGNEELSENEGPGFLVRGMEWTLTRHRLITVPTSIMSLVGRVNSDACKVQTLKGLRDVGAPEFAAETLLYNPPRITETNLPDGTRCYDVEMRFTWRPGGWNKFRKAGTATAGVWEPQVIYTAGGGEMRLYKAEAFMNTLIPSVILVQ